MGKPLIPVSSVAYGMYTMCIVQDGDKVLLLNRPDKRGFPGFIGPGGKVDFPESLTDGAIREVYEETGLRVGGLRYKGLDEFVNLKTKNRYMVFNYVATAFERELLENPPKETCYGFRSLRRLSFRCSPGSRSDSRSSSKKELLKFIKFGMKTYRRPLAATSRKSNSCR